jgi:membrane protein implicated in regulation of membrane protease activity
MRYILAALGVALGVAAVVAGGADDSPGLQLIGVVIVVGTLVWVTRRHVAARRR